MNKPKGILLDLDGTLYHGGVPIEGAGRLISELRELSLPYLFVTNNSSVSPETVASRLNGMGIPALAQEVCTSALAAASYIADKKPGAPVFIVGEAGLVQAAEGSGLRVIEEAAEFVLQGIDRQFTYDKLSSAVRHILGGAEYVLTNPDLLLPSDNGLIPGAGSLAAAITAAGGTKPTVIGKPSSILMDFALNRLGIRADNTWVVGDNLATDIAAGKSAGCGTALVLTGLTTAENMARYEAESGVRADVVFQHLDELRQYISEMFRT